MEMGPWLLKSELQTSRWVCGATMLIRMARQKQDWFGWENLVAPLEAMPPKRQCQPLSPAFVASMPTNRHGHCLGQTVPSWTWALIDTQVDKPTNCNGMPTPERTTMNHPTKPFPQTGKTLCEQETGGWLGMATTPVWQAVMKKQQATWQKTQTWQKSLTAEKF